MKYYFPVLQQSCTTAPSPKSIANAVEKIAEEDDRSKEVVVFGVASKVTRILEQMVGKPLITGCGRIGNRGVRINYFTLALLYFGNYLGLCIGIQNYFGHLDPTLRLNFISILSLAETKWKQYAIFCSNQRPIARTRPQ